MTKHLKLAVLGGDGIGPEVTTEALKVVRATGKLFGFSVETEEALVGAAAVKAGEHCLPDSTLKLCQDADAILFGAVGDPAFGDLPPDQLPERALLYLRKGLDLYANLRPVKPVPALMDASAIKRETLTGTDIMIVRELVSGIYFGQPRGYDSDDKGRYATNTMYYHEEEVKRIGRVAFESARKRKGRLCSADKANALEAMQLWRETIVALHSAEYGDLELSHQYVDNCAMQMVRDPKQFDVIVAGNMFGDILSDIGAQMTGSLGMLPSASIGDRWGLYEPVHGSAPDIAGKGIANPLAAILSASMLLTYAKGWVEEATKIDEAVDRVLAKGLRTPDLANSSTDDSLRVSTEGIGDAVVAELKELAT